MLEGFDPFIKLCRDVIAPLIAADGGQVYLVRATQQELVLHLGGRCSGCPGFCCTVSTLIEPCVHAIKPDVHVVVTNGALIPSNAVKIETATGVESERDGDDGRDSVVQHGDEGAGTVDSEVADVSGGSGSDGDGDVSEALVTDPREEPVKVTRKRGRKRRRGGRRKSADGKDIIDKDVEANDGNGGWHEVSE